MRPPVSSSLVQQFRAWHQRPSVRGGLRLLGLVVVVCGAIWSLATLELNWRSLSPGLLFLNLLVLTPLNILIAAIALRVNARTLGCDIPNRRSIYTVATANVAELLPLPGGAVVRGAALVDAGAGIGDSTRIIILTSLLTLFMTLTLSLVALTLLADPAWVWLCMASGMGLAGVLVILNRHAAPRYIVAIIAVRIAMLILTVLRVAVAFATLGLLISWTEAALYAVAPTLGAAVAIVPAGLGVNETVAAGLAALIGGSAATAFLAVALNRVLGLCAGAVMAVALPVSKGAEAP